MSTCVRKCTFARACNVGANSLNVVSRTFPHFSQSMLTPMRAGNMIEYDSNIDEIVNDVPVFPNEIFSYIINSTLQSDVTNVEDH